MMNPRAYSLSSTPSQYPRRRNWDGITTNAAEPVRTRPTSKPASKRDTISRPPKMASVSPAAPSKPVIIPTRTKTDGRHSKAHSRCEKIVEDQNIPHDSQALTPSAAAFFAIKSVRDSKGRKSELRNPPTSRSDCIKDRQGEGLDFSSSRAALSTSSPRSWRMLLSPPQELDDEDSNTESENHSFEPLASFRSLSSDSMPSLETDTESTYTSSSPSTPGIPSRGSVLREKRARSISSSVSEDCHSDHPLLIMQTEQEHESECIPDDHFETSELLHGARPRLSLRSNLTASFRRLKSAARTMTSFGAPSTSQDDAAHTQATPPSTIRFADERRPLPWAEPPDPALRRYLNPITISPAELYSHRDREEGRTSPSSCTASIQMQTYRPGSRKSENATAPPVFVACSSSHKTPVDEPAVAVSTSQRHREPRENSDFLRVIVLEMNMRKMGKLSDGAPGRARLWLPARQSSTLSGDMSGEVPRRWVSMSA
ncbi:MAG: hypothetical protein Q9213_003315 [Squamulea squamosa]